MVEDYIPPCARVDAHPVLLDWYQKFGHLMSEIEHYVILIIQKIKAKSQDTPLAEDVYYVSERMSFFLAHHMAEYKLTSSERSPVYMFTEFVSFAHVIKTAISLVTGKRKEDLMNYFNEWANLTPGDFDKTLDELIRLKYDHTNIHLAIEKTNAFFQVISNLFSKLSQLGFIGRKKGGVFVDEKTDEGRKEWTF